MVDIVVLNLLITVASMSACKVRGDTVPCKALNMSEYLNGSVQKATPIVSNTGLLMCLPLPAPAVGRRQDDC